MKFLPLRDFDIVTSALNFEAPDCRVSGGCDLYTTKAAGSDKKLYKNIDKSLESQHAALLKLGASLSPPQREELAASHNLSRSSPFGNLAEISSRRTFAYLIATLNASNPDYDFSHVLRPADFRRERSLRKVMSTIDNTLSNVRPNSIVRGSALSGGSGSLAVGSIGGSISVSAPSSVSPVWGPHMWGLIDKEMHLQDCNVFSYHPTENPFDEEDGAIWAMHYFFFSKSLKRVAYLYVRGVPILSHSPQLLHRRLSHPYGTAGSRLIHHHRRGIRGGSGNSGSRRLSSSTGALSSSVIEGRISKSGNGGGDGTGVGGNGLQQRLLSSSLSIQDTSSHGGVAKRAQYWLGDQYADRLMTPDDDDEDMADVLLWSREDESDMDDYFSGGNGEFVDDDDFTMDDSSIEEEDDEECDEEDDEDADGRKEGGDKSASGDGGRKSPVRAMSEDMAAGMDI